MIFSSKTPAKPNQTLLPFFQDAATVVPLARPQPFLKWAGGKRQLLPVLLPRIPSLQNAYYHEPFLGGGALFFALCAQGRLDPKRAHLADINPELINAYQVVRDKIDMLVRELSYHRNEEDHYYQVRAWDPAQLGSVERAARLIYLNKTCFNGLFRENRKGQFNVPFGHYAHPSICDESSLRAASAALQGTSLRVSTFDETIQHVQKGDFVYFDPPYAPISRTSSFAQYHAGGFDEQAHVRLAHMAEQMGTAGVHVMLSNSTAPWLYDLYKNFYVEEVYANRSINSRALGRGRIKELLVHAGPYANAFQPTNNRLWHPGESNSEPYAYEASALTA